MSSRQKTFGRAVRWTLATMIFGGCLGAAASSSASGEVAVSPEGTSTLGGLDAVDADPGGRVWAVGFRGVEPYQTLAQRWDGNRWRRVATPAPGNDSELLEVAAIGRRDAWAVGYYNGRSGESPLLVHWDGSQWTRTPMHVPHGDGVESSLFDVDGVSGSDAWAVGTVTRHDGTSRTLTMHWDGNRWSRVASRNLSGGDSVLLAVTALSDDDAWAVGYGPSHGGKRPGLTEHWDGSRWSVVPVEVPAGKTSTTLNAVAAEAPNRVWAVGRVDKGSRSETLAERWNGRRWAIVSTPSPKGGGGSSLNGATATEGEVWAVGGAGSSTLALRDVGTGWQRVHSPTFPPSSVFTATTAVSADDVWAVGFHSIDQVRIQLLSEHWNGSSWVAVQD